MYCINPLVIEGIGVLPCGMCRKCREMRSNQWAMRMMHEYQYWSDAIFLTLTYNDDNLPKDYSLDKSDYQKFLKRYRKAIEPRIIRYFGCGEYGETRGRPHYHFIIFGGKFSDYNLLTNVWNKGFIKVEMVNYKSCKYVTKYVTKAPLGRSRREASRLARKPEFQTCSRGLALRFIEANAEKLGTVGLQYHGRQISLPRYYIKKIREKGLSYQVVADNAVNRFNESRDLRDKLRSEGLSEQEISQRFIDLRAQKIEEVKTQNQFYAFKDPDLQ